MIYAYGSFHGIHTHNKRNKFAKMRRYTFLISILAVGVLFTTFSIMFDSRLYPDSNVEQKDVKFYDDKDSLKYSLLNVELKLADLTRMLSDASGINLAGLSKNPHIKKYPKVCCAVLTDPPILNRTEATRDTWTRRCDKRFFMSSARNDSFPTIGLGNDTFSRKRLIVKARKSWMYLYDHHLNDCDYFVKADPDTYMIIENLKEYLSHFDPKKAQHFGHVYHPKNVKYSYLAGGPGEVLSRASLKALVEKAFRSKNDSFKVCMGNSGGEDRALGQCLLLAGSEAVNTSDTLGRQRFIVFNLDGVFKGSFPKWYINYHRNEDVYKGTYCCSNYPIGFHYVSRERMMVMEYVLYRAQKHFDMGIPVLDPERPEIVPRPKN